MFNQMRNSIFIYIVQLRFFFCTFSGLLTGISKVYLCLKKLNKPKLISYGAKNVIPFLTPYGAKTGFLLAPYGAKTGNSVWHHMVLTTY